MKLDFANCCEIEVVDIGTEDDDAGACEDDEVATAEVADILDICIFISVFDATPGE